MLPDNFVCGRICMYFAFEVDIIAFLDVFRIQIRAQLQQQRWHNCTGFAGAYVCSCACVRSGFGGIRRKSTANGKRQ